MWRINFYHLTAVLYFVMAVIERRSENSTGSGIPWIALGVLMTGVATYVYGKEKEKRKNLKEKNAHGNVYLFLSRLWGSARV